MNRVRRTCRYEFAEGAKKCSKGKACSATCIYRGDECLEGLDPQVGAALNKLVERIKGAEASIGKETLEKALGRLDDTFTESRAKEVANAFAAIDKAYKTPAERDKKVQAVLETILPAFSDKRDTSAKKAVDEAELQGLRDNKANIDKMSAIYKKLESGGYKSEKDFNKDLAELAAARRTNKMSDAETDLAWSLLPKTERDYLLKAGVPKETGIFAKGQSTLEGNKGAGGQPQTLTPEQRTDRAKMLLKIYLEEGGKDMYSGRRLKLTDAELEHTIPAEKAGKWAESGPNFGWTRIALNRSKAEKDPEVILTKTLPALEKKKGVDPAAFNAMKQRAKAASDPASAKELFDSVNAAGLSARDRAAITAQYLNSSYDVNKTYLQGPQPSGRGERRIEWMKSGPGAKLLETAMPKLLAAQQAGNQKEVDRISKILYRIPYETEARAQKAGVTLGAVTPIHNAVVAELGAQI